MGSYSTPFLWLDGEKCESSRIVYDVLKTEINLNIAGVAECRLASKICIIAESMPMENGGLNAYFAGQKTNTVDSVYTNESPRILYLGNDYLRPW